MQNHSLPQVPHLSSLYLLQVSLTETFPSVHLIPVCFCHSPGQLTVTPESKFYHPSRPNTSLKSSWPAQKVTLEPSEIHTTFQSKQFYFLSTTSSRKPCGQYQSSIPGASIGSCTFSITAAVTWNYNCFWETHGQFVHHRTPQKSSSPHLGPFPVFSIPLRKKDRNLEPRQCWPLTHKQTISKPCWFPLLNKPWIPCIFLLPSLSNPSCPLLWLKFVHTAAKIAFQNDNSFNNSMTF